MEIGIESKKKIIKDIKTDMENIEYKIKKLNDQIVGIDSNIVYLINKNTTNTSKKNQIAVGNRIRKFITMKEENIIQLIKNNSDITKLKFKLNLELEVLNKKKIKISLLVKVNQPLLPQPLQPLQPLLFLKKNKFYINLKLEIIKIY